MEDMLLRVCVLLASLLSLKDPTIFEKEDDTIVDMQAQEHLLQKKEANLEQEVHAAAVELPHVSQGHHILTKEEGGFDVQHIHLNGKVEKPQVQQMQPMEQQSILHHEQITEDGHHELQTDKTQPVSKQAPNVDTTDSPLDNNLSRVEGMKSGQNGSNQVLSKGNEKVSQEDAVSVHKNKDSEKLNKVQASSTLEEVTYLDQVETTDQQKSSEEGKELPEEHQTSILNRLVQWFQALPDMPTSDNESLEASKQQQLQVTLKGREMAQIDKQRISEVHQGHSLTSNEQSHTDLSSSSQGQTKALQKENSGSENTYIWYLWKILSLLSLIRLLRKFIGSNSKISGIMIPLVMEGKNHSGSVNISAQMSLLDNKVLSCFYEHCVQIPLNTRELVCDFVEGFVDDLLEVAKKNSHKGTDLQFRDSVGVGSLYEFWSTGRTIVCDLYVPITAPWSYSFEFELDMAGCGRIKMVKAESTSSGCPCTSDVTDDDMLCLIHPHNETNKLMDPVVWPMCEENTQYLAKSKVLRWFRKTIKKAWEGNSHKYDFEFLFRNLSAPGALKVRLRSGQSIFFKITPVVQVQGSEVFLVSDLSLDQSTFTDIHWPVSLASYEKALLKHFSQMLPKDSCHIQCLQILSFLHKQQNVLTGKCGLKSYHLKIALLHLLLASKPADWNNEQLVCRLTDLLIFLTQRLQECKFHHPFIRNPLVPSDLGLPEIVRSAKQTNTFLPLLSDHHLYLRTVEHLQELVKNAPVLIQEFV